MHRSNPSTLLLAQLTFYAAPLLLVGCGFGTPAPPSPVAGVALQGHVFGGQQPVSGSIMQLYAVGNTGNGSLATPLILTPPTSGPNGSFSISNDYTCPVTAPATPVYLTATGGNPGLTGTGTIDNTALALVVALGPCNNLQSSTTVSINEATTAAAAWALSPFATSLTNIGATSTNLTGITNAFLTAAELADPVTGVSPGSTTPAGSSMESAKLYSLANVLASCVDTNGSDGNCSTLFADVTPTTATTPTNTFAAALNVVKNPGYNVSNIFGFGSGTPAFTGLPSAPADWTITISYDTCNSGCATGAVGIDSSGDVWTANTSLFGFSHQGVALSGSPFALPDSYSYGLAIDTGNHIWVSDFVGQGSGVTSGTIYEYDDSGNLISPSNGYFGGGVQNPYGLAFDSHGQLWISNFTASEISVLNATGGAVSPASGIAAVMPGYNFFSDVAIDGDNHAWLASYGCYSTNSTNCPVVEVTQATNPVVNEVAVTVPTYNVAVDTNNTVWLTTNGSTLVEINSVGNLVSSSLTGGGLTYGSSIRARPLLTPLLIPLSPSSLRVRPPSPPALRSHLPPVTGAALPCTSSPVWPSTPAAASGCRTTMTS